MEIKLSEISRRLLFRYYPLLLLTTAIHCIINSQSAMFPTQRTILGMTLFIYINLQTLFAYAFIVMPLYFFKPTHFFSRLILMTIFMILSSEIFFFLSGTYGPVPFMGNPSNTFVFLKMVSTGFFVIWIFFIAEKTLITEKKHKDEGLNRLSHKKTLVENQLRLLQAQIEPQFLFNTLSGIIDLRDINLEKAKKMQMHFIQYLRATLLKTRVAETTVEQEMDLIRAYLDIFKVRMGDRMHYEIDMDPNVGDISFPSMLIQPIVENAIMHGLEKKATGGKITISARKNGDSLKVTVADTGSRCSTNIEAGEGLTNVRQRLDSLFRTRGRMAIEDNSPSGIQVIIEVPNV